MRILRLLTETDLPSWYIEKKKKKEVILKCLECKSTSVYALSAIYTS